MSKDNNNGLIGAIVFAALVISGSLLFFGMQFSGGMSKDDLQAEIFKGIDSWIANEEARAAKEQAEKNKPRFVEGDFTDDDPFAGDEDAPVTIVEFADFECYYCGLFYENTLAKLLTTYVDTGKAKLVYRDLPLDFHPNAYPAALFGECVDDLSDDETFFKIHDRIFDTIKGGFNYDDMSAYAVTLGLDEAELKECFDGDEFKDEIEADIAAASSVGINGTPGFIINGQVVSGAQPFEVFEKIIEDELAK